MTAAKKPHERYYDDVKLGDDGLTPEVTVTKEMIRAYADLTGDHTPVHEAELVLLYIDVERERLEQRPVGIVELLGDALLRSLERRLAPSFVPSNEDVVMVAAYALRAGTSQ